MRDNESDSYTSEDDDGAELLNTKVEDKFLEIIAKVRGNDTKFIEEN